MVSFLVVVDVLLLFVFLLIIVGKFLVFPFMNFLQLLFFVLIIIHVLQHWKVVVGQLKGLVKK